MFPVRFASRRFHPKEEVIGVTLGGRVKAYAFHPDTEIFSAP